MQTQGTAVRTVVKCIVYLLFVMYARDVELKHTVPKRNSIGIVVWLIKQPNLITALYMRHSLYQVN